MKTRPPAQQLALVGLGTAHGCGESAQKGALLFCYRVRLHGNLDGRGRIGRMTVLHAHDKLAQTHECCCLFMTRRGLPFHIPRPSCCMVGCRWHCTYHVASRACMSEGNICNHLFFKAGPHALTT